MKKLVLILALVMAFVSCSDNRVTYPKYVLDKVSYVPDSLKIEHREYVVKIISSASSHMSGGDYEDVDITIIQAKRTADELFSTYTVGLTKYIDEGYSNHFQIAPKDFTLEEQEIFNTLSDGKN